MNSENYCIQLSDDRTELKDLLSNSRLDIHLGTLDEKELPNIHPAWYYYGQQYCTRPSQYFVLLSRRNTRIS